MLSQKITELREAAGMNKSELGRKVGVSDVTISYWESGAVKNISSNNLVPLASALGISVSELLDDPLKEKPGLEWAISVCDNGGRRVLTRPEVVVESLKKRLEELK